MRKMTAQVSISENYLLIEGSYIIIMNLNNFTVINHNIKIKRSPFAAICDNILAFIVYRSETYDDSQSDRSDNNNEADIQIYNFNMNRINTISVDDADNINRMQFIDIDIAEQIKQDKSTNYHY